jgi:hypothetical protein
MQLNLKVYVSSTSIDLKDYRAAVIAALRKMGMNPVCMEDYVAQDKLPVDNCLADVAKCDVYVVILARRYGFIPIGHDKSITELEYRMAVEKGIPSLIFMLNDNAEWPSEFCDTKDEAKRINDLRNELKRNRMIGWFNPSPHHLASEVQSAVHVYFKERFAKFSEDDPLSAALNSAVGLIETPGYFVRQIQTTEELTELWNIDRSAYQDVSLSIEEFYNWWSLFEYGLKAIFYRDTIIGALGIWPLREKDAFKFKSGEIKERELLPMPLEEVKSSGSRYWYASGIVLRNEYRLKSKKNPVGELLKIGLNTWIESPYIRFPAEVCSIAISQAGQRMLERFSFIQIKKRLSDVDPFPFYLFRAQTKYDLFKLLNKRGL